MSIIPGFRHILHGGDYNPEQWLEYPDIIDRDFQLMKQASCNTFSVGIFSWSMLEPEQDHFNFGWLDDIFERCERSGRKLFLATPSAAKPAWLAQRWPDSRRTDRKGFREPWGQRANSCYSSRGFRERVRLINEKLAQRYGSHPVLGGWHLGNEYCGECFCPACRRRFAEWLEKRYGSIEKLNRAYWSAFWGHRFSRWEDVVPEDGSLNITLLDWWRFTSDITAEFIRWEREAVRRFSDRPVTTNMMGFCPELDYYRIAGECDFIADDCYPQWRSGDTEREAADFSMRHDMHYTMKNKPFVMLESCPGIPNYYDHPKMRRPHEFEREMLLAVGHGADGTMYFQWRKGRGGGEKFHGAVVGHDGSVDTLTFRRVADYGERLRNLDDVAGSIRRQETAICFDYESGWAMKHCSIGGDAPKEYAPAVLSWYRALWKANADIAVISAGADFSAYRLLLLPMLFLFEPTLLRRLKKFVEGGGTAVVGYFSGYIDENDCCFDGGNPGGWEGRKLFGIWNEDFDGLAPDAVQRIRWQGRSFKVMDYAEYLHVENAETLACYECDFLRGSPAVTCRTLGKGKLYYVGARAEQAFWDEFLNWVAAGCGIGPVLAGMPPGGRVSRRIGREYTFYFFFNLTERELLFPVKPTFVSAWRDDLHDGILRLPPNGATVLKEPNRETCSEANRSEEHTHDVQSDVGQHVSGKVRIRQGGAVL